MAYVALFVVSSVLSLTLAEILARWFLPPPQTVHIREAAHDHSRRERENEVRFRIKVSSNPEEARGYLYILTPAGRRLRANTHAIIENHSVGEGRRIELSSNSIGYRNRELGPKSGKRLLFLGDSITLGDYLHEEETYVRRVEAMAHGKGLDWETINAGVNGISLKNELAILDETGLDLKPDVVVVGFYLNDFQESPGVFVSDMHPIVRQSRVLYYLLRGLYQVAPDTLRLDSTNQDRAIEDEEYHVALPKLYRRLIEREEGMVADWKEEFVSNLRVRSDSTDFYERVVANFSDWGGSWSPRMWEHVRPLFGELKRLSIEHDFKFILMGFPVRQQVEEDFVYNYPQRQLAQISKELEVPYLDLLPVLRAEYKSGNSELFYDGCHHTPEGNAVIAENIFRFIVEAL